VSPKHHRKNKLPNLNRPRCVHLLCFVTISLIGLILEKTKRRRSSAQPSLGGPSRRKTTKPIEPVVVEESEPEEEIYVRKVGRSKKNSTDAGSQSRRVSQAFPDDSGWEDNNIFQSGAESSPNRPSPVRPRTRRSSVAPRPTLKSRKSMSEPPQYASVPSDKGKQPEIPAKSAKPRSSVKPPSSDFEPRLPPGVARETRRSTSRTKKNSNISERLDEGKVLAARSSLKEEEEESDPDEKKQMEALREAITSAAPDSPTEVEQEQMLSEEEELADDEMIDEQVAAVSKRISEGGHVTQRQPSTGSGSSFVLRLILALIAVASSGVLYEYKRESAQIGFCEAGTATNALLEDFKARTAAIDACRRANSTYLYLPDTTTSVPSPVPTASTASGTHEESVSTENGPESCPPLSLIPMPHAETCTPCPRHATCAPHTMTCENGYILRPHPLLSFLPVPGTSSSSSSPNTLTTFTRPGSLLSPSADVPELIYSAISLVLDGMPGIGPVALAPRCVEDPRRKRHIGVLGRAIESQLATERGMRVCRGVGVGEPEGNEITEAKKWGLELEHLRIEVKKKTPPNLLAAYDDTFNEAVQQLLQWGGVFMGEDTDGKRYLAHRTPNMGLDCAIRVKARETWAEWQRSILGSALVILSGWVFRRRRAQNVVENERVASLVQVALELLRNQELAHHTDPVTAPQPYLSSLQLRDLVLQEEHSVSARRRLWERVERVVESNTNVRTNLEEVQGGDELRVWRWVGNAGAISPGSTGPPRKILSE